MRLSIFSMALIFILVLVSCSEGVEEKKWTADVKTVDMVTYVQNPDRPRDGVHRFSLVEKLSIGNEQDDNQLFIKVRSFAVDKKGRIFIPENKMHCIRIFGPDGKHIHTFGTKGKGPGDFDFISAIAIDNNTETIHALDIGNRKIAKFDMDGTLISEFKLKHNGPNFLLVDSNGYYYLFNSESDSIDVNSYRIIKMSPKGEDMESSSPLLYHKPTVYRKNHQTLILKSQYNPKGFFALHPNGNIIYGYSENYQLTVYDKTLSKSMVIARKAYKAKNVTDEERKALIIGFKEYFKRRKIKVDNIDDLPFPNKHRVMQNICVNEAGNILVSTKIEGALAEIDVFNPEGFYIDKWIIEGMPNGMPLTEILNKPVYKNHPQDGTSIYALVNHEDGLIQLKRYRVREILPQAERK